MLIHRSDKWLVVRSDEAITVIQPVEAHRKALWGCGGCSMAPLLVLGFALAFPGGDRDLPWVMGVFAALGLALTFAIARSGPTHWVFDQRSGWLFQQAKPKVHLRAIAWVSASEDEDRTVRLLVTDREGKQHVVLTGEPLATTESLARELRAFLELPG